MLSAKTAQFVSVAGSDISEQYNNEMVREQRPASKFGLWPIAIVLLGGILGTAATVGVVAWICVHALKAMLS